jgi:hypothetical protein
MNNLQNRKVDVEIRKYWMEMVEPLLHALVDKEFLEKTLSFVLEKESWACRSELINSHYIYTMNKALIQLRHTMDKLSKDLNP